MTRQGFAGHPLMPAPCLHVQVEALYAVWGPVQGAVGDEVVGCLRGATVAFAGGSQASLTYLGLETAHTRADGDG